MAADQIRRYTSGDRMIVTRFGARPIKAQMMPYYEWLPAYLYDADPDHGDNRARAFGRETVYQATETDVRARTALSERFGGEMSEADARAVLGGLRGEFTWHELVDRAYVAAEAFDEQLVIAAVHVLRIQAMDGDQV